MADNEEPTPAEPAHSQEPALGPAVDFITRVVAPASLLTAILYYFGYLREHALFAYFGVDPGSLGFSTTDYLVRSAGTIFLPIATVLVCGVLAVAAHHLLSFALSRANGRWARVACIGIGVIAIVLLIIGILGLQQRTDVNLPALTAPILLGIGALMLEYTIHTAAITYRCRSSCRTLLAGLGTCGVS